MSNLIQNGDFSNPDFKTTFDYSAGQFLGTNNFIYYNDLINHTGNGIPYWNIFSNHVSIQNGVSVFGYPDASTITSNDQYISLQQTCSISQTVTITQAGIYSLSFYYVGRPRYYLNPTQILFNGNLIDILTTNQNNWTFYLKNIEIDSSGNFDILFQGTAINDDDIAITSISLTYALPVNYVNTIIFSPASNLFVNSNFANPPLSANSFLTASKFTTNQLQGWTTDSSTNTILFNGQYYNFPVIANQYLGLIGLNEYVSQSVNVTTAGNYVLTFQYASSPQYSSGSLSVSVNSNIITTLNLSLIHI